MIDVTTKEGREQIRKSRATTPFNELDLALNHIDALEQRVERMQAAVDAARKIRLRKFSDSDITEIWEWEGKR